jgi:hypothetical protein
MVEGWSAQEFQVALEKIFPGKLQAQGLDKETAWKNGKYFPSKLLREDSNGVDHTIFYDKDGQQGNINNFKNNLNNKEFHEIGYTGGVSPLERARELYGGDKLRQAIYAFNIHIADQIRFVQEDLQNNETKELNSNFSQRFSNVVAKIFSPRTKK